MVAGRRQLPPVRVGWSAHRLLPVHRPAVARHLPRQLDGPHHRTSPVRHPGHQPELGVIAVITGGEGWHNNHHYLPASVRQGFRWWECDPTWYLLKGLAALHVVRDLKNPPARLLDQARVRDGAFDIGMFRSYWERAAKVTGERIADLSARPVPPSPEVPDGAVDTHGGGRAARIRRGAVGPGRSDHPGPRVGRPVGRGRPGGGRGRRWRRSPTPPSPHPNDADARRSGGRRRCGSSTSTASCGSPASPSVTWPRRCGALRDRGIRVVFATNNSSPTTGQLVADWPRWGSRPLPSDLVTSARVAASLLEPGERVHVLAEGGMLEALEERGVEVADAGPRDAAVVGLEPRLRLRRPGRRLDGGPRQRAAHRHQRRPDPSHPRGPDARAPGRCSPRWPPPRAWCPEVAGKPHPPMVEYVLPRCWADRTGRPR